MSYDDKINCNYNIIKSTEDDESIASNGLNDKIISSGDLALISTSGLSAYIISSGLYPTISSSGCDVAIECSGDFAQISCSGDLARIESKGSNSVICSSGADAHIKAKTGSWITLTEWVEDEEDKEYYPKAVKTEYVDGKRIKADTWYKIENGEFVEVK